MFCNFFKYGVVNADLKGSIDFARDDITIRYYSKNSGMTNIFKI